MSNAKQSIRAARRFVLSRLFTSLAAALGVMQVLIAHWVAVVAGAPSAHVAWPWCLAALVLAFANARVVPGLARARNRGGWVGVLLRRYIELSVATLLVGVAVAVAWLALGFPSALLRALGVVSPETAALFFRVASGTLVGTVALAVAWSVTGGQARIARTRVHVELPGLADPLAGMRVVQISDLHIGNGLEGARLARMVARVNAAEPDLVAITGDLFDRDPSHLPEARHLAGLRARHGVFAILGNHDAYVGSDRVADALARHAPNVRLLRDELVRLPVDEPLYLAGLEDPGHPWFDRELRYAALETLAACWPGDGPVLLLAHQPEVFQHAVELGFPLVLAGHTHGGQLALPVRGGHWNLARVMTPLTRGVYRSGGTTLYVNRGIGVGGPAMRFHCPREIATIELRVALA